MQNVTYLLFSDKKRTFARSIQFSLAIVSSGIFINTGSHSKLYAQDLWGPGWIAGYEFGVPLEVNRDPGLVNPFGVAGTGSSRRHTFTVGTGLMLPNILGNGWGAIPRLMLVFSKGTFTSDQFVNEANLLVIQQKFGLETSSNRIQLDALLHRRLIGGMGVGLGPWFGYRFGTSIIQSEEVRLIEPGVDTLFGEMTVREDITRELASSLFRFGLMASLSFTGEGATVFMPEAYVRVDGGALQNGLGIRALSGGVNFLLFLNGGRTPDPLPLPPPAASVRLQAENDTKDKDANRQLHIRMERSLRRHYAPFLPVVFFENNATTIPQRYVLLTSEEAPKFPGDMLARKSSVELYYHMLNVIGVRMLDNPGTTVQLYGAVAPYEPARLAEERAERIRSYWANIWGIERGRISIAAVPVTGKDASRWNGVPAVVIESASVSVLAPLVTEWEEVTPIIPPISVEKTIRADAGLGGWAMTISCGGVQIGKYTDRSRLKKIDVPLSVATEEIGGASAPIKVELFVTDSLGRGTTVMDELPVFVDRDDGRAAETPHREEFTFSLIDPGKYITSTNINGLKTAIAASVRTSAEISIAPSRLCVGKARQRVVSEAVDILGMLDSAGVPLSDFHMSLGSLLPERDMKRLPEEEILLGGVEVLLKQEVRMTEQ